MTRAIQLRYKGYLNTASLFQFSCLPGITNIEFNREVKSFPENIDFKNQRLGKLVEEFVFYQLKGQSSIKWIVENLQIQKERITIGELDALFFLDTEPIHLEVVYKFYLYDTHQTYDDPLAYWIGPNRKDTLCYKLGKLKNKQFPLLFRDETKHQLQHYQIDPLNISQKLCFKAQLFLPYNSTNFNIEVVNKDCITGFHLPFQDIEILAQFTFYIPQKLDWLVMPYDAVDWLSYETTLPIIETEIIAKRSPLVWVKSNATKYVKCFITFW